MLFINSFFLTLLNEGLLRCSVISFKVSSMAYLFLFKSLKSHRFPATCLYEKFLTGLNSFSLSSRVELRGINLSTNEAKTFGNFHGTIFAYQPELGQFFWQKNEEKLK